MAGLGCWRSGGTFQALPERCWIIPFHVAPVRSCGRLSLVLGHIGRVSARRPTDFFVVRQRSRQESVPRCRAPFGGALFPGPSGGVCANSPCGLRHAQPFFRLPNPPVGTPEGRGNAGDQRPVPDSISAEARCIRKARSDPPSSAAAGGAFRCGCLSRRSRRVPHRPPAGSSAGESAAGRPVRRVAFFAFLYGRLPCDKQVFEFWLGGFIAVLYPACWCSPDACPLRALMVIREVGAHLSLGLCTGLAQGGNLPCQPTV